MTPVSPFRGIDGRAHLPRATKTLFFPLFHRAVPDWKLARFARALFLWLADCPPFIGAEVQLTKWNCIVPVRPFHSSPAWIESAGVPGRKKIISRAGT